MISVYRFDKTAKAGRWSHAETLQLQAEQFRKAPEVLWIDLDNPSPEEECFVFEKFFRVHPLTLEDITRLRREPNAPPHLAKVEEFPDYLFVVANPLARHFLERIQGKKSSETGGDKRAATQLSAIVTPNLLITHHYEPIPSIEQVGAFLSRHESHSERGPDYLFHLILDGMVDQFAPVLDHVGDSLDEIETTVLRQPSQELLFRLLQLKQDIIRLRKSLTYQREVLARLSRGEFALIDDREMVYYRNVYDHLVRFTELIEAAREMTSDLMQMHLSATSNRLSEVMKALTMISTVVLPMSLVAGIYGMNFPLIPRGDDNPWGFPFALGLIALSGVIPFMLFKWKKWI